MIVPAFTAAGAPAWPTPAGGPVELAAYHHWTFHTRAGGDFAAIAGRLKLRQAGPDLGAAAVEYSPLPTAAAMPVRGALVVDDGAGRRHGAARRARRSRRR